MQLHELLITEEEKDILVKALDQVNFKGLATAKIIIDLAQKIDKALPVQQDTEE